MTAVAESCDGCFFRKFRSRGAPGRSPECRPLPISVSPQPQEGRSTWTSAPSASALPSVLRATGLPQSTGGVGPSLRPAPPPPHPGPPSPVALVGGSRGRTPSSETTPPPAPAPTELPSRRQARGAPAAAALGLPGFCSSSVRTPSTRSQSPQVRARPTPATGPRHPLRLWPTGCVRSSHVPSPSSVRWLARAPRTQAPSPRTRAPGYSKGTARWKEEVGRRGAGRGASRPPAGTHPAAL